MPKTRADSIVKDNFLDSLIEKYRRRQIQIERNQE